MKMKPQSSRTQGSGLEDPLLTLRFEVPRLPNLYVERRRLLNRLEDGAHRALTLVSAPAGSGKTTLLAAWVAEHEAKEPVAWLTFEKGDDSPDRFWPLVIEALSRCGLVLRDETAAGSHYPHRRMLMELSLALTDADRPLTLVLDGVEVTDARLADDIEFVLRHSGRRLRLVLLTRVDPVLRLHRFRLQDTVTELRMADLAFSEQETARLIEEAAVSLTSRSVATLVDRTRGWVAGLRFAAMVLVQSADPDETVEQLNGDSGNIAEYLMAEILQTQPAEAREVLLHTSVVDVLQPGLVEELGGRSAGRTLASLARANVLIEELAGHPGWFRYHPFLRDLMRAELAYASPCLHLRLQRRAASWFASQGHLHEAVAMSAASGAWTDAARYTVDALAIGQLIMGVDTNGLVRVLREMPPQTTGSSPSVVRAALALADHDPDLCAKELSRARTSLDEGSGGGSALALAMDVVETVRACRVDETTSADLADEMARRLAAQAQPGTEAHRELGAAAETLAAAAEAAAGRGREPLSVSVQAHRALVASLQGRLRHAEQWARGSITLAERIGMAPEERLAEAEIALAWVNAERYELQAAGEHSRAAEGTPAAEPIALGLGTLVRARLLRLGGEVHDAITLIDGLEPARPGQPPWLADRLHIERAEALIARGDPDLALRTIEDLRQPGRGVVALVRGRAQLTRGDWDAVAESVAELLSPESAGPARSAAVGGRLLEAAYELHRGHVAGARAALGRALRLAAPECLRRPFLEAPATIRKMLEADAELLVRNSWLGPAVVPPASRHSALSLPSQRARNTWGSSELVEPLTAKEQEVLGHLSELLTTQEIADTMFISVNTVRTHVASILRKLAVSRRNDAVRRARALSLIAV